jgi:hypothetical protein
MRPRHSTLAELRRDCVAAGAVLTAVMLGAWAWVLLQGVLI